MARDNGADPMESNKHYFTPAQRMLLGHRRKMKSMNVASKPHVSSTSRVAPSIDTERNSTKSIQSKAES